MRGESRTAGEVSPYARRRLRTPLYRLGVLLVVTFVAFVNYAALLSVVPLWASTGGAASAAVGSTTGLMMAATVATQVAMPWLFRWWGCAR